MTAKQAFVPVVDALTGIAGHIIASTNRHRTERLMARMSAHRLQDLGFERDWDRSVHRSKDLL